jgi:tetratricopeptide (TPR) repeat protein
MRYRWPRTWRWLCLVVLAVPSGGGSQSQPSAQASNPAAPSRHADRVPGPGANCTPQDLFAKASDLIKGGHYSAAASLLRQAATLAPGEASIHHYLGYALWKLNQWAGAAAEFQKAHQIDPKNPYNCYFLARIAQSSGHLDRSISFYEALLNLGAPIYDTNQRLGQAYFDKGELGRARVRIQGALNETPWDGSLYYQLGRIDQKMHRPAQAREEFQAAERLKQVDQASIQRLLALSEAVRDHKADAVEELRAEFLSQPQQDPEILDSVGALLGKAKLYADALEPLERSVRLAPDSYESNYNLGLTLLRLARHEEAETWLRKAVSLQPNSFEANSALAVLYVDQNRNLEAIQCLRAANRASPGDGRILALLGQQYLVGHYVDDAVRCLRQAIALRLGEAEARYLLVEAYQRRRRSGL